MKNREDVIKSYFIDKGALFKAIMDSKPMIIRAKKTAKGIVKQLMFMGIDNGDILDVGCGTGRIALELAELGYRVVGIDISPIYIEEATNRAKEKGLSGRVEFILCDVRDIESCTGNRKFDAAVFVWSSIIGYYDKETDVKIFSLMRKVVKENGVLLLVDFINKDYITIEMVFVGPRMIAYDYGDYLVLENMIFNPVSSEVFIKQHFYRREGLSLVYVDESWFKMRVYSLSELVDIARKGGWCLNKVLKDIEGEPGYTPLKPINAVFVPCKE